MDLQSHFGTDDRFRMDSRFLESDSEEEREGKHLLSEPSCVRAGAPWGVVWSGPFARHVGSLHPKTYGCEAHDPLLLTQYSLNLLVYIKLPERTGKTPSSSALSLAQGRRMGPT